MERRESFLIMFGVHPDLRRKVLVTAVSSAAVGATGAAALVLGWRLPSGPPWPFLLFAAAAFWVTYVGLVSTPRWYRYASRVVASTEPSVATIVLRLESDSDDTSLYASFPASSAMFNGEIESFPLLTPRWRVNADIGSPIQAKIYRDPFHQLPVAFQITGGLLWCLPYRRAG
jgi:hypothetical protein